MSGPNRNHLRDIADDAHRRFAARTYMERLDYDLPPELQAELRGEPYPMAQTLADLAVGEGVQLPRAYPYSRNKMDRFSPVRPRGYANGGEVDEVYEVDAADEVDPAEWGPTAYLVQQHDLLTNPGGEAGPAKVSQDGPVYVDRDTPTILPATRPQADWDAQEKLAGWRDDLKNIYGDLLGEVMGPMDLPDLHQRREQLGEHVADMVGLVDYDSDWYADPARLTEDRIRSHQEETNRLIRHRVETKGYDGGGAVWGPGGPKDDAIPARLSAGEYVWDAESVQRAGGPEVMDRWREEVKQGGPRGVTRMKDGGDVEQEAKEQQQQRLTGHSVDIDWGEGRTAKGRYEIRSMSDIVASHEATDGGGLRNMEKDGLYPRGLQPRDYATGGPEHTAALNFAQNLKPEYWFEKSPDATRGSSVITEEGGFALSGNKRQIALQFAKKKGTFEKYAQSLLAHAKEFGFDPDEVAQIPDAVMVRTVGMDPKGKEASQFAAATNISTTYEQSAEDEAKSISRFLDDGLINSLTSADPDTTFSQAVTKSGGREFREQLFQAIQQEAPTKIAKYFQKQQPGHYSDPTALTDAGKEFVQTMLLSKMLPTNLIGALSASRKNVLGGIEGAIPQLLTAHKDAREYDTPSLLPQLKEALGVFARNPHMQSGAEVNDVLAQRSFGEGGETVQDEPISGGAEMLLRFLVDKQGSAKEMRHGLGALAESLSQIGGLSGLTGDDVPRLAAESLGVDEIKGAAFGGEDDAEGEVGQTYAVKPPPGAKGEEGKARRGRGERGSRAALPPVQFPEEIRESAEKIYQELRGKKVAEWAASGRELPDSSELAVRRKAFRQAQRAAEKERGGGGGGEDEESAPKWADIPEAEAKFASSLDLRFFRQPGRRWWGGGLTPPAAAREEEANFPREAGSDDNGGVRAQEERGGSGGGGGNEKGADLSEVLHMLKELNKTVEKLVEKAGGLDGGQTTQGSRTKLHPPLI